MQGPTSHVASLQREPSKCASLWQLDGREREEEQFEYYEERWNWRFEGGEEWPVVSSLASRGHGEVPAQIALGAMSESTARQQQSIAHIATIEHGNVPDEAATDEQVDAQGL